MNIQNFNKYAFALALGVGFVMASSLSNFSTAQAQTHPKGQSRRDGGWERQREIERRGNNDYRGPVDINGNIDLNRNGIDDRYEARGEVDINQNGIPDREEGYDRNARNRNYGGYYGDDRYGFNNAEAQKGFRDGLDRGRRDADTKRIADPNNSSHYRKGSEAYRAGFRRGYAQGYHQYRDGRRW